MESDTEKEAVAAALRAQLQSELKSIKQCAYQAYDCTQITVEGYKHCLRHILQDKNAPYRQCAYVYNTNGRRCHLPAPRDKKETGYCTEHALKLHLNSSKRNSHCQPPRTAEVMLNSITHYIKRPKSCTSGTQQSDDGHSMTSDKSEGIVTKSLDPFVDIDVINVLATGSDILDMCSESESDVEPTTYGSVWHDTHAESSDDASIDSEQEDVLKHASAYSAEEVTLITRDKLMRLQSLYIDQYRFLQHMLREHRRRYLFSLKHEKETHCNIYNQVHENAKEQRLYKKLKAYNSYHKRHGIEAICVKRLHERRVKVSEGSAPKQLNYTKCIFTEGGVKCGEKTLPVTRHCPKHILEDPNQILFRVCGKMCGDIECLTPVEAIFDDMTCRLHMDFPPIRSYNHIRKESESDHDEVALSAANITPAMSALKAESFKIEEVDDIKLEDTLLPNSESEFQLESLCNTRMNMSESQNFVTNVSTIMASLVENVYEKSKVPGYSTEQVDISCKDIEETVEPMEVCNLNLIEETETTADVII